MRHPINCAVVTLDTGCDVTHFNADADVFEVGTLTVTDRETFSETPYPPGTWIRVAVYNKFGHYLYIIDYKPRPVVVHLCTESEGARA